MLRFGVLALCLGLLFYFVDFGTVTDDLKALTLLCIASVVGLALLRHFLSSVRWMWLNPDPSGQWHLFDYFRYTMISNTFNLVMPGALGGDVVRSLYIVKEAEGHRAANLVGMLVDRIVGLFSILVLGTLCGFFATDLVQRAPFLFGMSGILLAGVLGGGLALHVPFNRWIAQQLLRVPLGKRIAGLLDTWLDVLEFYRANRLRLVIAFLLCFLLHGIWFFAVYLIAQDIGIETSFMTLSMITATINPIPN